MQKPDGSLFAPNLPELGEIRQRASCKKMAWSRDKTWGTGGSGHTERTFWTDGEPLYTFGRPDKCKIPVITLSKDNAMTRAYGGGYDGLRPACRVLLSSRVPKDEFMATLGSANQDIELM